MELLENLFFSSFLCQDTSSSNYFWKKLSLPFEEERSNLTEVLSVEQVLQKFFIHQEIAGIRQVEKLFIASR